MIYQAVILFIMAVFYGCYFLKMYLQGRRGIRTDHMGKGKKGFVLFVQVTLKIVTIAVPIAEAVCVFLNASMLPDAFRVVGCMVAALGDAVFIISVVTMRDNWRAGVSEEEKTELVTSGIYRISRNPAFLGFDMLYVGVLLAFFSWPLFALSAFAMLMFHLQIVNVEEDFLRVAFGDAYLEYCQHVCRYIGVKRR